MAVGLTCVLSYTEGYSPFAKPISRTNKKVQLLPAST